MKKILLAMWLGWGFTAHVTAAEHWIETIPNHWNVLTYTYTARLYVTNVSEDTEGRCHHLEFDEFVLENVKDRFWDMIRTAKVHQKSVMVFYKTQPNGFCLMTQFGFFQDR